MAWMSHHIAPGVFLEFFPDTSSHHWDYRMGNTHPPINPHPGPRDPSDPAPSQPLSLLDPEPESLPSTWESGLNEIPEASVGVACGDFFWT